MDRVVAQRWFRAAAERGHPHAQMMLGRYLARGLTGEQDIEAARQWLERAVAQGLQDAKGDLAALPPPPPGGNTQIGGRNQGPSPSGAPAGDSHRQAAGR